MFHTRRGIPIVPLRMLPFILMLSLTACQFPGMIAQGQPLATAVATPSPTSMAALRLPQDEGPHLDLTEWWYYTGHLQGQDAQGHSHRYGFEFTFFQVLRGSAAPVYLGHYAITDLIRGSYQHQQQLLTYPTQQISTNPGFHLAIGDWTMNGLAGQDQLHAVMPDYALTIALNATTSHPALHNGDGILSLGDIGTTYYYSRPRMNITGSLMDHGATIAVTGMAWMDHQWGNFLPALASWDWFSIQLDDNTEYMVFFLTDHHTPPNRVNFVTAITATGQSIAMVPQAEIALGSWTSPTTHITYPSGWQITLPNGHFSIMPDLKAQEFVPSDPFTQPYWEGASTVQAQINGKSIAGQAYVELQGYQP